MAFEDITTHLGMLNALLKKYTFLTIANHEKNRLIIIANQDLYYMFQKKEEGGRYNFLLHFALSIYFA